MTRLDRWAAWLGGTLSLASLGLVLLADFGVFGAIPAAVMLLLSPMAAALIWRPRFMPEPAADARNARGRWSVPLIAVCILAVGGALIAPGSESVVGPRDPGVYVATGAAIARWGNTTIHDPALALLARTMQPEHTNAWLYENALNHIRVRFPSQIFVRDLQGGVVEGGFLPVVPTWMALAILAGGPEWALHVPGVFGLVALAFAMMTAAAAAHGVRDESAVIDSEGGTNHGDDKGHEPSPAPWWPLVGLLLAISFPQVWWAREPMAESALGAFTWITAWACLRWIERGEAAWAALAALATVAALFTRADAVLLVGSLVLVTMLLGTLNRRVVWLILLPGLGAIALHDVVVAPVYASTTYGAFTFGRAVGGVVALSVLGVALLGVWWLKRTRVVPRLIDDPRHGSGGQAPTLRDTAGPGSASAGGADPGTARNAVSSVDFARTPTLVGAFSWLKRAALLALVVVGLVAALTGVAPGLGRESTEGAISPLAWLPGYIPWPVLVLAAVGILAVGWNGVPRSLAVILLIGGVPALMYLPVPLVTGDHPWMVRRLVPAVIPVIAILASIGVRIMWRTSPSVLLGRFPSAGPLAAAVLMGLGLALQVAADRDLLGARNAEGSLAGLQAIAAGLQFDTGAGAVSQAMVVFPTGQAGLHLAMPLSYVLGVDAFAVPRPTMTDEIVATLTRMQAEGRTVYWAEEGAGTPSFPSGVSATERQTHRVRYETADGSPVPPPLRRAIVDHEVTLHRLVFVQGQ